MASRAVDPRIGRFILEHPLALLALPLSSLLWNSRLSAAQRRRHRAIVHYVDGAGYLPFAAPIWTCLARHPKARSIALFLAARPESTRAVKMATSVYATTSLPVRGVIPAWTCATLAFYDLFLTTHQSSVVPLLRRGPRLCTFHGLPAKGGTFVAAQWRHLDGAFLHGPLQRRLFEEYAAIAPARPLWSKAVGYPKSDALVRGQYRRTEVLGSLGLSSAEPTVLYAPSWEEGASLRESGYAVVARLLDLGVQVLLKLHPMSYYPPHEQRATGGRDWARAFDTFESCSRFRHVRADDAAPLVSACDLLVTDVSSIAFEAFLADRPVVFIDVPHFFEFTVGDMYGISPTQAREDLRFNCGRGAGRVVDNIDELGSAVLFELRHPGARAAARARVRHELVFHPGAGAAHTASAIAELLALDPLPLSAYDESSTS